MAANPAVGWSSSGGGNALARFSLSDHAQRLPVAIPLGDASTTIGAQSRPTFSPAKPAHFIRGVSTSRQRLLKPVRSSPALLARASIPPATAAARFYGSGSDAYKSSHDDAVSHVLRLQGERYQEHTATRRRPFHFSDGSPPKDHSPRRSASPPTSPRCHSSPADWYTSGVQQSPRQYYAASPRPSPSHQEFAAAYSALSPRVSQAKILRRVPTRAAGFSFPAMASQAAAPAAAGQPPPQPQQQQPPPQQQQQRVTCMSRSDAHEWLGGSSSTTAVTSGAVEPPVRHQLPPGPSPAPPISGGCVPAFDSLGSTPAMPDGLPAHGLRPGAGAHPAAGLDVRRGVGSQPATSVATSVGDVRAPGVGDASHEGNPGATATEVPAPKAMRSWKKAGDLVMQQGAQERRGRRRGGVKRAMSLQDVLGALTRDGHGNRWQATVLSAGFQAMLTRRLLLLKKLRAVLGTGMISTKRKLETLSPLPLFRGLARHEILKIARCMTLKLIGRYTKILRAGTPPAAYYGEHKLAAALGSSTKSVLHIAAQALSRDR